MTNVVIVHHANQLLITDGYADRDGITPVADAVVKLVDLHSEHGVPCSLHLSGTLIEALAWHRPSVLDAVRCEAANGLLELVGGAYGEPVLPLLSDRAIARHLDLTAHVMQRHLAAVPTSAWVPERVWHPRLGPLLNAAGYTRVALDDRLLLDPAERAAFDDLGPWQHRPQSLDAALCRPVTDTSGVVVAPITAALRYLIPPRTPQDLELLGKLAARLPDDSVLVYADDLERTCGVAGWEPALDRYAEFIAWVARSGGLTPVRLDQLPPPDRTMSVQAGTYYELAHAHGAGEDYTDWAADPRWAPSAQLLARIELAVDDAPQDARSTQLAERLLLVGQHETAWQDLVEGGGRAPAPWARATAAHSRDALPVLHAGRWARAGGCAPTALMVDVDGDGRQEILLADWDSWCVVSPEAGGRVTLLAVREDHEMRLVVGNPLDHWNFQTESHRYMHVPAAHPGAFTMHDEEDAPWEVTLPEADDQLTRVILTRPTARRVVGLASGRLLLCSETTHPVTVESHLSPDHLQAVEDGSSNTTIDHGPGWARIRDAQHATWCGWDMDGAAAAPRARCAPHGMVVATRGQRHFDLVVGVGDLPARIDAELARLRGHLHSAALVTPSRDQSTPDFTLRYPVSQH